MLIDLTRRPVRITFEECPTVVVVRTLGLRGKADGLLHHEGADPQHPKHYRVDPSARRHRGTNEEFIETVLTPPRTLDEPDLWTPDRRRVADFRRAVDRSNGNPQSLDGVNHLYVVTGFMDQITRVGGVWRINVVFDPGKNGTRLLTLLDETNSTSLLTVHVPARHPGTKALFSVRTPLQRLLMAQTGEPVEDLWSVLRNEE